MSRLTIDITDQQHQALKAMAALEGKSIKQYAVELLFPGAPDSDAQALSGLRHLLEQRLADANQGALVSLSVSEIASQVLSTRGHA